MRVKNMHFREDARRDCLIPDSEMEKRFRLCYLEFCRECAEKYSLKEYIQKGNPPVNYCMVCGNERFLPGRVSFSKIEKMLPENGVLNLLHLTLLNVYMKTEVLPQYTKGEF